MPSPTAYRFFGSTVPGAFPTASPFGPGEQYLLELINRTREDPRGELERLLAARTINREIDDNLNFWAVDLTVLRNEFGTITASYPLGWNPTLANVAQSHSQIMAQNQLEVPSHQLPGEPDITTRLRNSGYLQPNFGFDIAENLPAILTDILAAHASMVIDWGPNPDGSRTPDGMEPGRGHRTNMLTTSLPNQCNPPAPDLGSYDEIGIAIVLGTGSVAGKNYITQDFGYRCDRDVGHGYLVGVVYRDLDGDGVYSMGEGLGGVTLTFRSRHSTVTTTTNPWGGYQILLGSADWVVDVSGPTINPPLHDGFFITGRINRHLNFVVP